jgi:hypothetical protein
LKEEVSGLEWEKERIKSGEILTPARETVASNDKRFL